MAHMVISGKKYEVPENFKLGELRLIKQVSGLGAAQLMGALENADPDVIAALAMIVMRRAGEQVTLEQLDDLGMDELTLAEEAEDPPVEAAPEAAPDAAAGSPETTPQVSGSPATALTSA